LITKNLFSFLRFSYLNFSFSRKGAPATIPQKGLSYWKYATTPPKFFRIPGMTLEVSEVVENHKSKRYNL
jgi:hypothetical protein